MTQQNEVILCPDFGSLGEGDKEIWVIETPVKPGDFVKIDDTVLTVESEKATMEIPAEKSGKIIKVFVEIGDILSKQMPMFEIEPLTIIRQDFRGPDDLTRAEMGNSVFLVHGHNDALREMAARFMEKLGLEVVILQERVSQGATIIEKLERNSYVQFAVVLMTADDIGTKKNSLDEPETLRPRARQNVILELGYFMGRIGRANVCVLFERGVELPSDYYGVVFIEIDTHGAWRYALAKELRQGGLSVDLNKL